MNNYLDLSKLTVPQLWAIRNVLVGGATATASKHDKLATAYNDKKLKELAAENERLKKLNERRKMLEQAGLSDIIDFDDPDDQAFVLRHSNEHWQIFLNHLEMQRAKAERETALAERTKSIRVPNLIGMPELNAVETVREHFKEMRDHRRNGGNDE